jgi:hypothetical protein
MGVDGRIPRALGLRAGVLVEVRAEREILSTLDELGRLDGLPFMPEMLQHCGKQFRVFRRADKTCDTISSYSSRRMTSAVHLEGLRCDGGQHGGCQAGCLLFWKEAWLKPPTAAGVAEPAGAVGAPAIGSTAPGLTRNQLDAATTRPESTLGNECVYVCQATELPWATTPLAWWDPRQYIRELRSGNVLLGTFIWALAISWYNALQRRLGGREYPHVAGTRGIATPSRRLDLQPGERVRIRSAEEIQATLGGNRKNRGLWFDVEMVGYCGGEYRVLRRVNQIIDERTGKMRRWAGDCIILDGVTCQGCLSRNRLFCPRSIYPYWREIWLERVGEAEG